MTDPPPLPSERRPSVFSIVLRPFASLKLTVALLAMSMVLVFAGTWAQTEQGIYQVLGQYFRTFIAMIDLQVFFPPRIEVPYKIPFPGGWTIGGLMVINLLAAQIVRFKFSAKYIGILLIHLGLIIMLIGEVVTGLMADEGTMLIEEGSTANYVEHSQRSELAVIDRSDPAEDAVTVVPGHMIRAAATSGQPIRQPLLPFDITVNEFMPNAVITSAMQTGQANPATAGDGLNWLAIQRPPVSGVDPNQRINIPAAYVTFTDRQSGRSLGVYLLSPGLGNVVQPIDVDGRTLYVTLRFARTYKPFTLELVDFRHDRYLGTDIPRNFASSLKLTDPQHKEEREVLIYMNHPLRHAGLTFYQASFTQDEKATVLQVVRNPGRQLPYISSAIVTLGLVIQFIISLIGAVGKAVTE